MLARYQAAPQVDVRADEASVGGSDDMAKTNPSIPGDKGPRDPDLSLQAPRLGPTLSLFAASVPTTQRPPPHPLQPDQHDVEPMDTPRQAYPKA